MAGFLAARLAVTFSRQRAAADGGRMCSRYALRSQQGDEVWVGLEQQDEQLAQAACHLDDRMQRLDASLCHSLLTALPRRAGSLHLSSRSRRRKQSL